MFPLVNPLDIYARAAQHQPLTPGERAFLKTLGALSEAAVAASAVAIIRAALDGGQPLTFQALGQIGAVAGATALVAGVSKLIRSHGDPELMPLADALDAEAPQVAQTLQTLQAIQALGRGAPPSVSANTRPVPAAQPPTPQTPPVRASLAAMAAMSQRSAAMNPAANPPMTSAPLQNRLAARQQTQAGPQDAPQAQEAYRTPPATTPSESPLSASGAVSSGESLTALPVTQLAPAIPSVPAMPVVASGASASSNSLAALVPAAASMPRTPVEADLPPTPVEGATLPNIPAFLKG